MIHSGTTTYADMYYFEEQVARTTKEAGLLMRDRKILTLNEAAVLREARALAAQVRAAVGR